MPQPDNNTSPTFLIAPDKFKGSLSARQVCEAISRGIQKSYPQARCLLHPMADGGDGSLAVLADFLETETITVESLDPLGRSIQASYLKSGSRAFIELAAASGIVLLSKEELNPLRTSTEGTGLLIKDALSRHCYEIFLFAGGSATNDAAIGIAHALGFRFLDQDNKELQAIGENLIHIARIEIPQDRPLFQLRLLSDVTNPLYGPNGAAYIYARQKGADDVVIAMLDKGLKNFAEVVKRQFGKSIADIKGAGCAGGVGAGCIALLNANIQNGFEALSDITQLEERIREANFVITGEGKMDEQTLQGKVVAGVAALCRKHRKPCMAFAGVSTLTNADMETLGLHQVKTILSLATDVEDAMTNGMTYLEALGRAIKL